MISDSVGSVAGSTVGGFFFDITGVQSDIGLLICRKSRKRVGERCRQGFVFSGIPRKKVLSKLVYKNTHTNYKQDKGIYKHTSTNKNPKTITQAE